MSGTIYSGTITTGITLSDPATQQPATVSATGNISVGRGYAITGLAGTAWTVSNAGTITGSYYGITLASGGLVTNTSATAVIGANGVHIAGAFGTVVNSGTLGVSSFGAVFEAGGSVVNNTGGTSSTVRIRGGAGTIVNNGQLITGNLYLGGTVTNTSGTVNNAIAISGAAGTVINAGSINHANSDGRQNAVGLKLGGSVTNAQGGRITSLSDGISVAGAAGAVLNAGTIAVTQTNAHYGVTNPAHAHAINLAAGGTVNNTGSISAGGTFANFDSNFYGALVAGINVTGGSGTVTNAGTITAGGQWVGLGTATVGVGIAINATGQVTNLASGVVTAATAVDIYGAATVSNFGTLVGTNAYGVTLRTTGSITNAGSAFISGFFDGIRAVSAPATVSNDGSINGPQNYAVRLGTNGVIINSTSGRLTGGSDGVLFDGTGASLVNAGLISGAGTYRSIIGSGAYLSGGGSVTNSTGGQITGKLIGVGLRRAGTISNAGTILGATGISITGTAGSTSTVINSGTITGTAGIAVKLGAGDDRLVVNPGARFTGTVDGGAGANTIEFGAGTGTLGGLGSTVTNFGSIVFDAGAAWTIIGSTAGLTGVISGFAAGDVIDLAGLNETGSLYSNGTLTLTGDQAVSLQLPGGFSTASFSLAADGAGGTNITVNAACFAQGTKILTTAGEIAVEQLPSGARIPTVAGNRVRPIRWLGYRHVNCRAHPVPRDVWPIRIAADAFAPGAPHADLLLSPDHAVYVAGALIPIRLLLNGRTVTQVQVDAITYWHVECDAHDVLLANGLAAETYLDTGNRSAFANAGGPMQMAPDFAYRVWDTRACLPLTLGGPRLTQARLAGSSPGEARGSFHTNS